MCLRWGTTLQIVLKKPAVDENAIRSLKPNDTTLREGRERTIFFFVRAIVVTKFIASWWDQVTYSIVQCQQMGKNFSMVTFRGLLGFAGLRGWRWLWEVTTTRSRQLHTRPSWACHQRRGKTKQEQQPNCDTSRKVSASEECLAQLTLARTLIPISLSPGTGSHVCPRQASYPSPSSWVVRGQGKACATEQHISGFWVFVGFSLWEGLGYCYPLSAGAAWSLHQGKPWVGWPWRSGCPTCGNLLMNKCHYKYCKKATPCYINRCASLILYFKSPQTIVWIFFWAFSSLHLTGKDDVSVLQKGILWQRASKKHKVTIKPMVQPRTDSNRFQCVHYINISSSCCLCCADWIKSSMCRSLCKQSLLSPI